MQELEKILKDIEKLKEMYKESACSLIDKGNLPWEYSKSDVEVAKMQALLEAIAIIRKHMNGGWIPVEEQLPKERNLYLATAESAGFYFRLICHWNAPGWTEETGQQKIIAWRPLPEPYQAERSDNNDGE